MVFFDLPSNDELPAESARWLEEYRKVAGHEEVPRSHRAYGRLAHIVETRLLATNLHQKCTFPNDVKLIGAMLIAHARRCQGCFAASRNRLRQLGFDEDAMNSMCAHPNQLPMTEKNRAFVNFALKVATAPAADLTAKDFAELAAAGFSREEMQETIGFAVYWVMNTIFNSAALVALTEE